MASFLPGFLFQVPLIERNKGTYKEQLSNVAVQTWTAGLI